MTPCLNMSLILSIIDQNPPPSPVGALNLLNLIPNRDLKTNYCATVLVAG